MNRYLLLTFLSSFCMTAMAQAVVFEENFDSQPDWQTSGENSLGNLPNNWNAGRTDENWHPASIPGAQPSMKISGGDPDKVFGSSGKAFITYSESYNDTSNNGFTSDGFLTKDIPPTDKLYVEFKLKFQPGFASDSEGGQIKLFRALHWDGGERHKFFTNGNSAPIYLFDWAQNSYGLRQFHAFRCDDQENNYYCVNPSISGAPRNIITGDMSANFIEDLSGLPNTILDLVNGGTIPTSGKVHHNQVYGSIWHTMAFYLQLNSSPGVKDGILKVWIDGNIITDMTSIPWIGNNGDINAKWNSVSFGGNDRYHFQDSSSSSWAANKERWYAIDEITIMDDLPVRPNPPSNVYLQ